MHIGSLNSGMEDFKYTKSSQNHVLANETSSKDFVTELCMVERSLPCCLVCASAASVHDRDDLTARPTQLRVPIWGLSSGKSKYLRNGEQTKSIRKDSMY